MKTHNKMGNSTFHFMTIVMGLMDFFTKHSNKKFRTLEIQTGQFVVDYGCGPARFLKDTSIDVIYALDMFHMIKKSDEFLSEFYRILKLAGTVILEDGHQSRTSTKEKIKKFGLFKMRMDILK